MEGEKKYSKDEILVYIDTITDRNRKEIEHHIGILNEAHGETLKQIKEFYDTRFQRIEDKLDAHSRTLDSHTEMIGTLMTDVTEIKETLKQKLDRSEFIGFKQRLAL